MTAVCPRCAHPRDQREGPYFVCAECRWCWTVSITGKVYVECDWPPRTSRGAGESVNEMPRRLLRSVEGLRDKLAEPWPPAALPSGETALQAQGFDLDAIARLHRVRAATSADYFNEGLPLRQLRADGVRLPPPDEPDGASP